MCNFNSLSIYIYNKKEKETVLNAIEYRSR